MLSEKLSQSLESETITLHSGTSEKALVSITTKISFKTSKLKTRENSAMISPLPGKETTISVDYS